MVYTIGSGATPSATIGQGAVPSSSTVPIGSGATPNWNPPSFNPPRIDFPSYSTDNNNRAASRSFNIDLGTSHHHHDSFGYHDHHHHHHCDDNPIQCEVSPWCCGIVCLLILVILGVFLTIGFTTDLFSNMNIS